MISSGSLFLIGLLAPIAAIVCGLLLNNKYPSIIIGIAGPIVLYYSIYIYSAAPFRIDALYYFGTLIILGGLTGYFSSIKKIEYGLFAACLCLFYLVIYFGGIAD